MILDWWFNATFCTDIYAEIERQEKLRKKRAEDEAQNSQSGKVLAFWNKQFSNKKHF